MGGHDGEGRLGGQGFGLWDAEAGGEDFEDMAASPTSCLRLRRRGVLALALLAASLVPAGSASTAAPGDDAVAHVVARYRERIPELMAEQDVPGLAVTLARSSAWSPCRSCSPPRR
jgi:hypothetical protein